MFYMAHSLLAAVFYPVVNLSNFALFPRVRPEVGHDSSRVKLKMAFELPKGLLVTIICWESL